MNRSLEEVHGVMGGPTRTEPLDRAADEAWADLHAVMWDRRDNRALLQHRPLIEAAIRSAEAREAARLRTALEEIDDLFHNDNIRPGTFAMRAGAIAAAALTESRP
jgi:hypothetical protein